MNDIQKALFSLQDPAYRDFQAKLMPTVDKSRIIGIRTPVLRKEAKEFAKTPEAEDFLKTLPHKYYEENNLHAFLVAEIKEFDRAMEETERFLPYIDNWATCDSFVPKAFRKHPERLLPKAKAWLKDTKPYTVRYGIKMLMDVYLDEHFSPEYPAWVAAVRSDEYYVKMMQAWYFATALAKQEDNVLPYIKERKLPPWVHNKTIQKAVESFRISPELKEELKKLRIK